MSESTFRSVPATVTGMLAGVVTAIALGFRRLHSSLAGVAVGGVVADAQRRAPGQRPENFYYIPAAQWYNPSVMLHVRTQRGLESNVAAAMRQSLRALDPSLPMPAVRPLNDALDIYFLPQRLAACVSGAMGILGSSSLSLMMR